ncbi:HNH endonuclease [Pantoea sp.]|uniref:HNH endonuclease n=1 Tax=Pantoea sp. TaxID=69393 RepID=UPI0029125991|nr:HNH endonuclease [Pantoea sp.]MDU5475903.1 HNH endonuclease [Pantoea sp.]
MNVSLNKEPSIEFFRECFTYDAETGELRWKERPKHHFKTPRDHRVWNNKYPGMIAGSIATNGYRQVTILGYPVKAHRIAWMMHSGKILDGVVDHINGVKTDNRICNLRQATAVTNARNKKSGSLNKSGKMGVYWVKADGKWRARIGVDGKYVSLGVFDDLDDAIAARRLAEIEYGYHENHGRR